MLRWALMVGMMVGGLWGNGLRAADPAWGAIVPDNQGCETLALAVRTWPAQGVLPVPTPQPNLVMATLKTGAGRRFLDFEFNATATELKLHLPAQEPAGPSGEVRVVAHTAEKSRQFPDGRIVLSALDATVHGTAAKLESHPGSHRIGFWSNAADFVSWKYQATRWGMYRALLTYSTAAPGGGKIELKFEGDNGLPVALSATLASTGSWYRYTTLDAGKVYLPAAGRYEISVKCLEKVGAAVMNLKAVVLVPECEGTPPVQAGDGSVNLHARDATVQGEMLRWEPAEKKQTLGYWTRPTDRARWTFTLNTSGEYEVEVLQGCGTGQGGSPMVVRVGEQSLPFVVEETGHFQNFKPRVIGRVKFATPGEYELTVGPEKIAHTAACDIRQIRLVPAGK